MIEDQTELRLESWSGCKVIWFRPEKVFSGGGKNSSFRGCDSEYFRSIQLYDKGQAWLGVPRSGGKGGTEIYRTESRMGSLNGCVQRATDRFGGRARCEKDGYQ